MTTRTATRRAWLTELIPTALGAALSLVGDEEQSSAEGVEDLTASVDERRCITFRGPECGACAGMCPSDSPALVVRRGRPEIAPAVCVGCGQCVDVCPTTPPSISMVSRAQEPVGES